MIAKWLHLLAFGAAFGGGTAALILGYYATRHGEAATVLRPAVAPVTFAVRTGIVLLWLTGLWMWIAGYGAAIDLGWAWWLKLAAVLALTHLAFWSYRRAKTGRALSPDRARLVGFASLTLAAFAVLMALVVFGG
ncbi:MAG: hypothetical protein AAGH83_06790 [Pseudomonadota bacterium]